MFFNNLQKNQHAANVDQQITPESTLCVELSDEELCAVNGGTTVIGAAVGAAAHISTPVGSVGVGLAVGIIVVLH